MNEPNLRIVRPQAEAAADDSKMLVQLTVRQFRQLIADTVRETMNSKDGEILDVQGAMTFLNVSQDWIYRHWKHIGGRKIGKAIRFYRSDLNRFMKSRQGI
jgi:predicted DNA-binding transcriptional regulator AlpA